MEYSTQGEAKGAHIGGLVNSTLNAVVAVGALSCASDLPGWLLFFAYFAAILGVPGTIFNAWGLWQVWQGKRGVW